jgi:hypothetical protein
MSVMEVTTKIDRRYLERKTKAELAGIILNNIDRIDLFGEPEPEGVRFAVLMAAREPAAVAKFEQNLLMQTCYSHLRIHPVYGAVSMGAALNTAVADCRAAGSMPDVVVFTHEDVEIWAGRRQWQLMLKTAMRADVGFVGVAGTEIYLSGAWWDWQRNGKNLGSVAHHQADVTYQSTFGPYGDADAMDGVFLAVKPGVLAMIGPWPEDLGWHFYDIWATVAAKRLGLRNIVFPLPLLHYSIGEGSASKEWADSERLYREKYFQSVQVTTVSNVPDK